MPLHTGVNFPVHNPELQTGYAHVNSKTRVALHAGPSSLTYTWNYGSFTMHIPSLLSSVINRVTAFWTRQYIGQGDTAHLIWEVVSIAAMSIVRAS